MSRRPKLADKEIDQDLEDLLLGILDYWDYWDPVICFGAEHILDPKRRRPGAPKKLDTGARDLMAHWVLYQAKVEGGSERKAANDLAAKWKELGLCNDSGETLRQTYLRQCRTGPTESMRQAAAALMRSKAAGR